MCLMRREEVIALLERNGVDPDEARMYAVGQYHHMEECRALNPMVEADVVVDYEDCLVGQII